MLWTTESGQCYESWLISSLFKMSTMWGNIWLTVDRAFSRGRLIKQLISGDLDWRHELGREADSLNNWYNVPLLHCITRSYVFILYMMFYWIFECSAPQPGTVYLLRYAPPNCRWAPSSAGWRLSFSSTRDLSSGAVVTDQRVRRRIQIFGLNSTKLNNVDV